MKGKSKIKQITAVFLLLVMTAFVLIPAFAAPQKEQKVVRVGWYDSPFNMVDSLGRRSGYAYEYQQKIAAHTGWTYKYVMGSWGDLIQMLKNGEIDMLSDVSYTDERAEIMLFSSLPMGTEEYFIFTSPDNTEISGEDYTTLNGKTIGVTKDSFQADLFKKWARTHGISATIAELTVGEGVSFQMMNDGEIDAYVSLDAFASYYSGLPIVKIGSSDFYFAVSKSRPDLLGELDVAISKIQDENRYYNQHLSEKYLKGSDTNLYLSKDEKEWLSSHGTIRVGYQDNYLAFCASDKSTGKLTGALKDCLNYISDHVKSADIKFEAVAYPTATDAIKAMKNGEVDCVFPANFDDYDAEMQEVVMMPTLMKTGMYAVIRESDQKEFFKKENITVAVNEGNPNYDIFLMDNFPGWKSVYFKDTPACLLGISKGKADCLIISTYRFGNISGLCKKYHLTTASTGVELDYSFAINRGNTELYTILAKVIKIVPESAMHAALSYYSAEDSKLSFVGFINENIVFFMTALAFIALIIITLLIRNMRSKKRADEERELIIATETDGLTGLYNKNFFFEYVNKMYKDNPETPMDAIVLNIEQFNSLNTVLGRKFGENVLHALSGEILRYLDETEGIAGRFETDQFGIYCAHHEDYTDLFDRLQNLLDSLTLNASIKFRMGIMPYQKELDPTTMFESAQTACNMVRKQFKKRLIVFDETIRTREIYEQHLLNDLRRAIESEEFEVYYQPQYDIQADTPKLCGAEALVRWNHPTFGLIMPSDFIPLFERNGQISLLDEYVWEKAFKQCALWHKKYGVKIPVSINISRIDFFDNDLIKILNALLEKNGLSQSFVNLEITESAYADNSDELVRVLNGLKENGYNIEMDDFGSGYSSLNMLSSAPIDIIKMDGIFMRNIESDETGTKLVALILDIAENLKVPVIAEGVETEYQLQLLKKLNCRFVQGFYLSKPLPASEFEERIIEDHQI